MVTIGTLLQSTTPCIPLSDGCPAWSVLLVMQPTFRPVRNTSTRSQCSLTAQDIFWKLTARGVWRGSYPTPTCCTSLPQHSPLDHLKHRTRTLAGRNSRIQPTYAAQNTDLPPSHDEILYEVDTLDPFPSKLATPRRVAIMLPPSYISTSQRYPVLYMHDGQNCIDPKTSFLGVDWGLDECMHQLLESDTIREFIAVLIWNTPQRPQEYMPAEPLRWLMSQEECWYERVEEKYYNPTSDAYLVMLVKELKPYVDEHYRTLPDRDNTMLMGSSMGGLISLYALQKNPEVFGAAACLSPHWLPGRGVPVAWLAAGNVPDPNTHRLYFDYGTEGLDAEYGPYQTQVDSILEDAGYTKGVNLLSLRFDGETHNEIAWRKRLHIPVEFLFGRSAQQQY